MEILMQGIGVSKTYGKGSLAVKALDHIDFSFGQGELVVILGESGAGKSTLLNLLGGMDTLSDGKLLVKGEDISRFSKRKRTEYRKDRIGFVFQFYNLMPNLTAKENVELAVEMRKDALSPVKTLQEVGLGDQLDYFPAQLSGGQQQRVSIARAIAKNCDCILCDEPTGALDYQTGKDILALLEAQAHDKGKTVIIVTHNAALAAMADHLLRIRNGKIIADEYNPSPKRIADITW